MRVPESSGELGSPVGRTGTPEHIRPSLAGLRPLFLCDLIRVGPNGDGGYVVNERAIRHSRHLLSLGVAGDWRFELDFLKRKPDVEICCFDPGVSTDFFRRKMLDAMSEFFSLRFVLLALLLRVNVRDRLSELKYKTRKYRDFLRFTATNNVRFYEMAVWNEKTVSAITVAEALRLLSSADLPENSVFVKMDIEQDEFRVLPDLLAFADCVNGMVVEFHNLDILWSQFLRLLEQLRGRFEITHVHANNFGGYIPASAVPRTLEITFLKKSLIEETRPFREDVAYPVPELDFPADSSNKDYSLIFS